MTRMTSTPHTSFDWAIYADATFAGLSVLIPFPLLDLGFEWWFRRRMPKAIARRRTYTLRPEVVAVFNRGRTGYWDSCLGLPFKLIFIFLKRLSKKILYFLTVKEAIDQLSRYWRRAFLLDYMLLTDCLNDVESAGIAAEALESVLDQTDTSPLNQLARQVVAMPWRVLRSLRRLRRGQEDQNVAEARSLMARTWDNFADYFAALAVQFDQAYQAIEAQRVASQQETGDSKP